MLEKLLSLYNKLDLYTQASILGFFCGFLLLAMHCKPETLKGWLVMIVTSLVGTLIFTDFFISLLSWDREKFISIVSASTITCLLIWYVFAIIKLLKKLSLKDCLIVVKDSVDILLKLKK